MSESGLAGSRNLRLLKWATIVLPLAFLIAINYVGHFLVAHFETAAPATAPPTPQAAARTSTVGTIA